MKINDYQTALAIARQIQENGFTLAVRDNYTVTLTPCDSRYSQLINEKAEFVFADIDYAAGWAAGWRDCLRYIKLNDTLAGENNVSIHNS